MFDVARPLCAAGRCAKTAQTTPGAALAFKPDTIEARISRGIACGKPLRSPDGWVATDRRTTHAVATRTA
jgi:hypothetical protein